MLLALPFRSQVLLPQPLLCPVSPSSSPIHIEQQQKQLSVSRGAFRGLTASVLVHGAVYWRQTRSNTRKSPCIDDRPTRRTVPQVVKCGDGTRPPMSVLQGSGGGGGGGGGGVYNSPITEMYFLYEGFFGDGR
ncbi:hypothetical protein E2C01_076606 [Portunus trituberculatus]|uniref:Uncharacterized protein n=1 Tax=Portunus trituberculatus TaxID=210409 RepID=A0A5B7IP03_PORTR|nr:hypothetical protein [Portunus trituberculatus]